MKTVDVFVALAFLLTVSCNDDESKNCREDEAIPVETFYAAFGDLKCNFQNVEEDDKELFVISNQEDLDMYLDCPTEPQIDFRQYFVIAGIYTHHQCAVLENQVILNCHAVRLIHKVLLSELACQAITPIFYAAVIERKYLDLPIERAIVFSN